MRATDVAVTTARIISDFVPFPGVYPAVEIVCRIIEASALIKSNRNLVNQLCTRCQELLMILRDFDEKDTTSLSTNMKNASAIVERTLAGIEARTQKWASKSYIVSLAKQSEIKEDLTQCHLEISHCLDSFQLASHLEIHRWHSKFEVNQKQDHEKHVRYLGNPKNSEEITNEVQKESADPSSEIYSQLALNMQHALADPEHTNDVINRGLQSNLYDLQIRTGQLLPDPKLEHGEVRRIGTSATDGDGMVDVWEGLWLDREKVQIKVLRAARSSPKSLQRFQRAAQVWSEVWKVDRGKYILPFWGYSQNDGPFPYVISPWQRNGTAISFVKAYPEVDHRHLIRGIACGINVLHNMDPPIVHGTIRGRSVYISDAGEPLLADFGVSKMIADITDVPFTQSQGVADAYRWLAPECWEGEGILSIKSDIHSYGMTVLELMTHKHPYAEVKHTPQMLVVLSSGKRPDRPMIQEVIERGLDDTLWNLMGRCWAPDAKNRPTIQNILADLGV